MRLYSAVLAVAVLAAPVALSAQSPESTPCAGTRAIIRVSDITPEGSVEKFQAAVAAHQAWYKSHGLQDVIFATPVLSLDRTTGTVSDLGKQFLTYHFYGTTTGSEPAHDAAWDAYVKLYNATSKITQTYFTCFPQGMAPSLK